MNLNRFHVRALVYDKIKECTCDLIFDVTSRHNKPRYRDWWMQHNRHDLHYTWLNVLSVRRVA